MISIKTAENALKDVYLCVISNKLNIDNKILSKIIETTSDIWGKEIIVYDTETKTIKELQTICCDIVITDKAVRCCEYNSGAFVNLLNAECDNLINVGIDKQLKLLCEEIRKDCNIKVADKELLKFLNDREGDFITDNIKLHQLCDWRWLENEDGNILMLVAGETYFKASILKYCNFIFTPHFKEVIKKHFKGGKYKKFKHSATHSSGKVEKCENMYTWR